MIREWIEEYKSTDDLNKRYKLLRAEMKHLRRNATKHDRFNREGVKETIRALSDEVGGYLVVFAANDFGLPMVYRPADLDQGKQDDIRQAILANKYATHADLNSIREKLLEAHPDIHKALVVTYSDEEIKYHLPGGTRPTTNFLTVREAVGLVDYTTNSSQREGLSQTY